MAGHPSCCLGTPEPISVTPPEHFRLSSAPFQQGNLDMCNLLRCTREICKLCDVIELSLRRIHCQVRLRDVLLLCVIPQPSCCPSTLSISAALSISGPLAEIAQLVHCLARAHFQCLPVPPLGSMRGPNLQGVNDKLRCALSSRNPSILCPGSCLSDTQVAGWAGSALLKTIPAGVGSARLHAPTLLPLVFLVCAVPCLGDCGCSGQRCGASSFFPVH